LGELSVTEGKDFVKIGRDMRTAITYLPKILEWTFRLHGLRLTIGLARQHLQDHPLPMTPLLGDSFVRALSPIVGGPLDVLPNPLQQTDDSRGTRRFVDTLTDAAKGFYLKRWGELGSRWEWQKHTCV
jgi:hypothetical protein